MAGAPRASTRRCFWPKRPAAAVNGSRFYENSFKVDELGTAATLLAWSDLWYQHGWDGTAPLDSTARLRDMSAVAALALTRVFPGVGLRLNEVAAQLLLRECGQLGHKHRRPLFVLNRHTSRERRCQV